MRANRPAPALLKACALALTLGSGCGHNRAEDFPLSVGFQPLEPLNAAALPPAASGADPFPQGLGAIVAAPGDGHYASHAQGYVHAPLARVYQALHDPAASLLHNSGDGSRLDGPPLMDVEPSFPVSFRVRYSNATVIGDVKFDVTYRAGPLQGTDAAPTTIGERYQKTWGTSHIRVMSGSLVATPVAGSPDVTLVQMIAWLDADTQYQSDCNGTLTALFGDLVATIATLPP